MLVASSEPGRFLHAISLRLRGHRVALPPSSLRTLTFVSLLLPKKEMSNLATPVDQASRCTFCLWSSGVCRSAPPCTPPRTTTILTPFEKAPADFRVSTLRRSLVLFLNSSWSSSSEPLLQPKLTFVSPKRPTYSKTCITLDEGNLMSDGDELWKEKRR